MRRISCRNSAGHSHEATHLGQLSPGDAVGLLAIARYKLVDAFRSRGRRIEIDIDDVADMVAVPETESVTPREIDRILETLPPARKAAVAAISVEGLSIPETAARLGWPRDAVRVALHRGPRQHRPRFGRGS